MNSTLNSSMNNCTKVTNNVDQGMRVFIAVCMSAIIVVSFFGNVLVCIAFKVNKNLRIVSNYFILNLAVSDLVATIFVMPFDVDILLKNRAWYHGELTCNFYTTMYLISAPASILNLLAVSIDRFRVISDPFTYERTTTPFRALVMIAVIWVYATLMGLLPVMGWKGTQSSNISSSECPSCYFPIPFSYSILISVLHFVIPPLVMAVVYFKIYKIARSHVRRIHRLESITGVSNGRNSVTTTTNIGDSRPITDLLPTKSDSECNGHQTKRAKRKVIYRYSLSAPPTLRKNVKAAKSLAIIVGIFFACWYPFTLVSMVVNACGGLSGNCYVPLYVYDCLLTIGYLNSMLNPFLYAFHNAEFKRTYRRILRWKKVFRSQDSS